MRGKRFVPFVLVVLAVIGTTSGEEVENVLGMKFVSIPVGEFLMGTSASDIAAMRRAFSGGNRVDFSDETPQHPVRITTSFMLAVCEVTVGQFRTFVDATGYQTDAERDGEGGRGWNRNSGRFDKRHPAYSWRNAGFAQKDDHPVVNVSWNDTQEFCSWLGRLENRSYRLPTEAEWEYACRAGTTTWFHNGNAIESLVEVGNVTDRSARQFWGSQYTSWTYLSSRDGAAFTCPVGQYEPNAWGLYDMHGNVWEWCADSYSDRYYEESPPDDPKGPASGETRCIRGGSWGTFARRCRAAFRNSGEPDERHHFVGFRVVLDPSDS